MSDASKGRLLEWGVRVCSKNVSMRKKSQMEKHGIFFADSMRSVLM